MRPYIESFLPLFVAINPMGIIPIYLSVTEHPRRPSGDGSPCRPW